MTTTLPATQAAAPASEAELIATYKQTVCKGFTDAEMLMFMGHVKGTGLNPFKREIWGIKTKDGTPQIMTGVNGYYEIANRHPMFDGIEVETVDDGGKLVKAVARVYRKDRSRPTVAEAYMSEYGKAYGNWQKMPRLMLSKCAESMALRKAFPQELNGTYTDAEMPREYSIEPQPEAPKTNGTPRTMPANERPEPDTMPDLYKLEAPKSTYGNKKYTLAEIHEKDPKWIPATLKDPKRRAGCTKRDIVNLEAFWAVMGEAEVAKRACADEFDREAVYAEIAKIEAEASHG